MTRHLPAAAAALTAALLAVPAIRHWRERPPDPPPAAAPLHAIWAAPEGVEVGAGSDYVFGLALGPDGRRLVYPGAKAGVVTLWLHDLRNGETAALPGTEQAAAPFWSPDGTRIGFFAGSQMRVIDLDAGSVSSLAPAPSPRGGTWNAAGDIVFAATANAGLMRRSVDGSVGPFTTLDAASGETAHAWPAFLPDGRHAVFLVTANDRSRAGIWITSIDDPASRRRLVAADSQPLVAAGMLLFATDRVLVAQRIDIAERQLTGRSSPVGLNVGRGPLGQTLASATDDVVMFSGQSSPLRQLQWRSRDGNLLGRASEPVDAWDLRIAPDGSRVVVTEVDPQLRTLDVFVRSGPQPVGTRLSPSIEADESAVWSPDGLRIAWVSRGRSVMIRGAGAVLPEQTIVTLEQPIQVWDWTPDGRSLLIGRTNADTRADLWIQPAREGAAARPYDTRAFNQTYGAVSPDGRWIAYASDEAGRFDIYIDSFPAPGSRLRATTAGGTEPRWGRNHTQLFFRRGSEMHAITLSAGPAPAVESINLLFDAGAPVRSYDVSGGRFLLNLPSNMQKQPVVSIVHHWSSAFTDQSTRRSQPR